ncbi:MAG: hypothetical protein P1U68_18565 [Verrucomicrobiales bacterium]|nr:hypothetical protein [Verrucomicrobiales bacterium]
MRTPPMPLSLTTITLVFASLSLSLPAGGEENFGTLIFEDRFERNESQEAKDEPGNGWTTSSDKTAKGYKQVDLRDGAVYIYTHAEANHATSFRHEFAFQDGTIGLRFQLEDKADSVMLNFADLGLKSVHAGHLFKVLIGTSSVLITDQKTGEMNLEVRNARKAGTLTEAQKKSLAGKSKRFSHPLKTNAWHQVFVTVKGDALTCRINGEEIGTFSSEGFAHETKTLLRLLIAKNAFIDDVKIWRLR